MCYISFGAILAATRFPRARFVLLSSFFLVRAVCIKCRSATEGFKKRVLGILLTAIVKARQSLQGMRRLLCLREQERQLGVRG